MPPMTNNLFRPEPFFIGFSKTYLHGDILSKPGKAEDPPAVLCLHDATKANDRTEFYLLRQLLLRKYDLSSCTFDFIGHGGTAGTWEHTSLQQGIEQILDIVDSCFDCQPFNVVAVGMSAYMALKILPVSQIANLVLITPVIDDSEMYPLGFSAALDQQGPDAVRSLDSAGIWNNVKEFRGGLCSVVTTCQDGVVSSELATQLDTHAIAARQHSILEVSGDPQALMASANNEPAVLAGIAHAIAETCAVPAKLLKRNDCIEQ